MTVVLHRPDGVEAARTRLVPNAVGVAVQPIPLNPTAPRGTWRLEEMLAGTKTVIGTLELQVQDFVPNRLAVELTPRSPRITQDAPAIIDVASRYLYGAPAADLQVSAHVQLQRDTEPVAEHGWVFGRADEPLNADAQDIDGPPTDAQGHSALSIDAAALKLPKTSAPLRADVAVAVAEPGGRATESRTTLKVATHDVLLGLRAPNAEALLPEDHASAVSAAAFAPDGSRLARTVAFRLVEQVTDYNYFAVDGRWEWKSATHDRPVTFGTLDVPAAEGGGQIGLPPLQWGTYRLEVSEQGRTDGAFTSLILHVGFDGGTGSEPSPERVAVSLRGPAPAAGQDATLHIKPPFAGQMLITVENSRTLAVQTASIPADGADVTVHATADWGVGAYVMASVYRPSGQASGHAPVRAVGLAYVKLDAGARTIGVSLATPAVLRPRTPSGPARHRLRRRGARPGLADPGRGRRRHPGPHPLRQPRSRRALFRQAPPRRGRARRLRASDRRQRRGRGRDTRWRRPGRRRPDRGSDAHHRIVQRPGRGGRRRPRHGADRPAGLHRRPAPDGGGGQRGRLRPRGTANSRARPSGGPNQPAALPGTWRRGPPDAARPQRGGAARHLPRAPDRRGRARHAAGR